MDDKIYDLRDALQHLKVAQDECYKDYQDLLYQGEVEMAQEMFETLTEYDKRISKMVREEWDGVKFVECPMDELGWQFREVVVK